MSSFDMSDRRILILSHLYPNVTFPHEGTYVADVIPHLSASGWRPYVAVPKDLLPTSHHLAVSDGALGLTEAWRGSFRLQNDRVNCRIKRLPYVRLPGSHRHYHRWRAWMTSQLGGRLDRLQERKRFDAILAYGLMPEGGVVTQLRKRVGVPVVVYAVGSDLHSIPDDARSRSVAADVLSQATLNLTVSNDLRERALRLAPEAEVRTLPLGVDLEFFEEDNGAKEGDGYLEIALVTVFKPVKNPLLAVKAFRKLRDRRDDVLLHLVGDGPLLEEVRSYVRSHGLEPYVRVHGFIQRRDVAELLRRMDALLLSSRREGTPRVILEALAVATPVVATRVGGVPDLLSGDDCGRLVPPDDVDAMAEALEVVLGSKWDPSRLRSQAAKFEWQVIGQRLAEELTAALRLHSGKTT